GLLAIGIFNVLGQWNQFLLPLVLNPNPDNYELTQGLAFLAIQQGHQNDYSALFAALVITMIPMLVVYVLFQRRLESGLTAGALKGWLLESATTPPVTRSSPAILTSIQRRGIQIQCIQIQVWERGALPSMW